MRKAKAKLRSSHIGLKVRDIIKELTNGQSVNPTYWSFKSTLNLVINDQLITLTFKPVRSAFTINLVWGPQALPMNYLFSDPYGRVIMSLRDNEIIISCDGGNLLIDLTDSTTWIPRTLKPVSNCRTLSPNLIIKASRTLRGLASIVGCGIGNEVISAIKNAARRLARTSLENYAEFLHELIKSLGLGDGLTPGVDDFLMGAAGTYNALIRLGVVKHQRFSVSFSELLRRTNTLSAMMIEESLGIGLNEGIDGAAVSHATQDYDGLINSLITLLGLGHSSGYLQALGSLTTLCLSSSDSLSLGDCVRNVFP